MSEAYAKYFRQLARMERLFARAYAADMRGFLLAPTIDFKAWEYCAIKWDENWHAIRRMRRAAARHTRRAKEMAEKTK